MKDFYKKTTGRAILGRQIFYRNIDNAYFSIQFTRTIWTRTIRPFFRISRKLMKIAQLAIFVNICQICLLKRIL